ARTTTEEDDADDDDDGDQTTKERHKRPDPVTTANFDWQMDGIVNQLERTNLDLCITYSQISLTYPKSINVKLEPPDDMVPDTNGTVTDRNNPIVIKPTAELIKQNWKAQCLRHATAGQNLVQRVIQPLQQVEGVISESITAESAPAEGDEAEAGASAAPQNEDEMTIEERTNYIFEHSDAYQASYGDVSTAILDQSFEDSSDIINDYEPNLYNPQARTPKIYLTEGSNVFVPYDKNIHYCWDEVTPPEQRKPYRTPARPAIAPADSIGYHQWYAHTDKNKRVMPYYKDIKRKYEGVWPGVALFPTTVIITAAMRIEKSENQSPLNNPIDLKHDNLWFKDEEFQSRLVRYSPGRVAITAFKNREEALKTLFPIDQVMGDNNHPIYHDQLLTAPTIPPVMRWFGLWIKDIPDGIRIEEMMKVQHVCHILAAALPNDLKNFTIPQNLEIPDMRYYSHKLRWNAAMTWNAIKAAVSKAKVERVQDAPVYPDYITLSH
ncbi:MAG: hypothetical protein GY740_20510, partial [Gammaproteobacteria bacterium]|nr:hypothetical protein [Gammaproteobacteria bacterium]